MARLTFESVRKYAEECDYTLEKLNSKGYTLNSISKFFTLADVMEAMKSGEWLYGETCQLPIAEDKKDYPETPHTFEPIEDIYETIDYLCDSVQRWADGKLSDDYLSRVIELYTQKRKGDVFSNLPSLDDLCKAHYDTYLRLDASTFSPKLKSWLSGIADAQIAVEKEDIPYEPIEDSKAESIECTYQVICLAPTMTRYEVPAIPAHTLKDVVDRYNELPLYIPKISLGKKTFSTIKGDVWQFLDFAKRRYILDTCKGTYEILYLMNTYDDWCLSESEWCKNSIRIMELAYPEKINKLKN